MNIMTAPDGKPKSRHRTFLVRDLKAALKAAKGAGGNYKVDVDKFGTISVVPMAPGDSVPNKGETNEWDEVLKKDE